MDGSLCAHVESHKLEGAAEGSQILTGEYIQELLLYQMLLNTAMVTLHDSHHFQSLLS